MSSAQVIIVGTIRSTLIVMLVTAIGAPAQSALGQAVCGGAEGAVLGLPDQLQAKLHAPRGDTCAGDGPERRALGVDVRAAELGVVQVLNVSHRNWVLKSSETRKFLNKLRSQLFMPGC